MARIKHVWIQPFIALSALHLHCVVDWSDRHSKQYSMTVLSYEVFATGQCCKLTQKWQLLIVTWSACLSGMRHKIEGTFRPQTKSIWSVFLCARLMLLLYKNIQPFSMVSFFATLRFHSNTLHHKHRRYSTWILFLFIFYWCLFIFGWYGENSLQLNVSRTKEILFSIFGENFTQCAVQPKHQARSSFSSF